MCVCGGGGVMMMMVCGGGGGYSVHGRTRAHPSCLQLNTWLSRYRYLIVAASKGISSKNEVNNHPYVSVCVCLRVPRI